MKDAKQIRSLLQARRTERGPFLARAEQIKRSYNGDMIYPLPELDAAEASMVANLVQGGIDQLSMRISSVWPNVIFPPKRAGKAEANRANKKRDVVCGWHERNRLPLRYRRRARWFVGYGTGPVMVTTVDREPFWRLLEPFGVFPAPTLDPDELVPPDCVNTFTRSREWLLRRYPEQMTALRKGEFTTFELIEYVDAEEHVLVACGAPQADSPYGQATRGDGSEDEIILTRAPNKANRPLVVTPGRITMDRPLGAFDGSIGMMHAKSMFMALGVIAQKRAIFPEQWLISAPNNEAAIVQDAEPMSGQVGIVAGAASMQQVRLEPSVFTANYLDRLEYEARQETSTPAEWGGSGSQNVRTGRRGAQVMEAATDFPIQEAQSVLEAALEEEDKIAIALAKAYQHKPVSFYVRGRGEVTYLPRETFDDDTHEVRYPVAGADSNALTIQVGQNIGMGTMSKESAMGLNPLIRDVEAEMDRITAEKVGDAFLASIQTLASNPEGPWQPEDFARFAELVLTDKEEPYGAAQKVIEEAKARQLAQQQQQAAPEEMMPGLAQPGQPGAPVPAIGEPNPSMGNLSRMLAQLRLPQMRLSQEQTPIGEGVPVR